MADLCKKCNTEVTQNYCPNCGHPKQLKRVDHRYVLSEIGSVLNFQKGLLYTIKELLIRPGQNIRTFISEDRSRLMKPIMFILITSLIYTLFVKLIHFEDGYMRYSNDKDSFSSAIAEWIQGNYGYANIVMAVFIGLWLKIFFKKQAVNIFEILILLCFVMGVGMLIYTTFGILQSIIQVELMQFGTIVVIGYTTFAIGQFFDKSRAGSYVKAFFADLLGMLSFAFAAILIGIIGDVIVRL